MYRCQSHGFITRLLGRGFHTLKKNVSFPSPTDVGSHNKLHKILQKYEKEEKIKLVH